VIIRDQNSNWHDSTLLQEWRRLEMPYSGCQTLNR
jgi:hypothetical protein